MAKKKLSKASQRALAVAADKSKGDAAPVEGGNVATVEGETTDDDASDVPEPDDAEPAQVEPSIQWGQSIERNAILEEPEARTRERLTAFVGEGLGLTVTPKLLDEGWALVVAKRASMARELAIEGLRKRVASYTLPDSLKELAMVAGTEPAKASLVLTVEGEGEARKVVLSVVGAAPRTGGNGGGRGPRGSSITSAPAGVKGGAAQLLWDGKPLTSEMLRTVPDLKGSESYVNKNAAGKLMPGRSKPFGPNTNMNAGQALLAFTSEPGREGLRARITKGERSKS